MQYAKDEIKQRIIDAAREEFLNKGFEKASIRVITGKAGTAKSNLYNYFQNKDDLFYSVLEPTVAEIRNGLALARQYNAPKNTGEYTLASQQLVIGVIAEFVASHSADIKLLLFKAQGSSLEAFKYEVLETFTDNMYAWAQSVRTKTEVSRLFVRSICSFYLNLIEQLFLAGPASDMEKFLKEISVFIYHGWKNVLS